MAIPANEHYVFIRHAQPAAAPAAPWQKHPEAFIIVFELQANCNPCREALQCVCERVLDLYVSAISNKVSHSNS